MLSSSTPSCSGISSTSSSILNLCSNSEASSVLKCCFCEKVLSVPPIYSCDNENICGRCKFVEKRGDVTWSRQIVYEKLAQFMLFPCSNSTYGCKTQLKWNQVEDHESSCIYKKLSCPFADGEMFNVVKCKWIGSGPALNSHLESVHKDSIRKLTDINFTEFSTNLIFLTRTAKQLMIVIVKQIEQQKFHCLVMINGSSADCDSYRYQLELSDEHRSNAIILRRNRVEDAISFQENMINQDKMLVVDLDVVNEILKRPQTIKGRFGIVKKSKREINNMGRTDNFQLESILRELECPICKCYLSPPIHICSTGHSFCGKCKAQLEVCPTCRNPFQEARNYTLEKVTASITYPCLYKDAGCEALCPSEELREHELNCSFSGVDCFLHCNQPVVDMFEHILNKHNDRLIVSGELNIVDVDNFEDEVRYYALCFGNDIFRLVVEYDDDMKFVLHQFGVKETFYNYELEIICSTETSTLSLTKQCLPLSDHIFNNAITIPADMICNFISEDYLIFFKVHLKKIIK